MRKAEANKQRRKQTKQNKTKQNKTKETKKKQKRYNFFWPFQVLLTHFCMLLRPANKNKEAVIVILLSKLQFDLEFP